MKKINPSGLCSVIQKFCVLLAFTAVCMAVISGRRTAIPTGEFTVLSLMRYFRFR